MTQMTAKSPNPTTDFSASSNCEIRRIFWNHLALEEADTPLQGREIPSRADNVWILPPLTSNMIMIINNSLHTIAVLCHDLNQQCRYRFGHAKFCGSLLCDLSMSGRIFWLVQFAPKPGGDSVDAGCEIDISGSISAVKRVIGGF